jgi:hypothetical protein
LTNPHSKAVFADIPSPSKHISKALAFPTKAVNCATPYPGGQPKQISGIPNRAAVDATRKSQAFANTHPAPIATPFTTATITCGNRSKAKYAFA